MIHNLSYNSSSDYKKVQPFEYLDKDLDEYSFEYSKDILSDLSKFNAPIFFTQKERRGIIFDDNISSFSGNVISTERDKRDFNIFSSNENGVTNKRIINSNIFTQVKISTADAFKILFGKRYCYVNIFNGFVGAKQYIKKSHIYDTYFGYMFVYGNINYNIKKTNNILNTYETMKNTFSLNNTLSIYDQTLGMSPTNVLNIYKNYNTFKIPGYISTNILEHYFGHKINSINDCIQNFYTINKEPEKYFLNYFDNFSMFSLSIAIFSLASDCFFFSAAMMFSGALPTKFGLLNLASTFFRKPSRYVSSSCNFAISASLSMRSPRGTAYSVVPTRNDTADASAVAT